MLEFDNNETDWLKLLAIVVCVFSVLYLVVRLSIELTPKKTKRVYIGGSLLIGEVEVDDRESK